MRNLSCLFVLSILLLGCNSPPSQEPISSVNGETMVVLQSDVDNYEVIQEFALDNCDGKADATRTEHRSSSIDVTISTELAARIGASAQVISADVQAAVGTALNIGGERGTSIEVKAPPNTHMFFQLTWVGKSRIGVVQNASGSGIPVAFQSFSPDNVRIKSQYDIGCPIVLTPSTQSADPQNPIVPESTRTDQLPPTSAPITSAGQQSQCQWLEDNFPQSPEEVISEFNLSSDTVVSFIYELCPSIANAFGIKSSSSVELQVPTGGCIDSWAGFTEYIGDVGTPVPDGWGGWRVYQGTVRAPEMTYRIMGCP